jgi:hypothetical protein
LLIDIHLLDALGKRGVEHGGIARALRDAALRHVGRFEPGGEILPPQPIQAIEIKRLFSKRLARLFPFHPLRVTAGLQTKMNIRGA